MRMRMLRSLASAPAGRLHILPISALARTFFTPTTHEQRCIDHFQFYPQPWMGPGPMQMRVLHSLASTPAEQRILIFSTNMAQNNSDSFKMPMEQLRLLQTNTEVNNYKTATLEKLFEDTEISIDCEYEETHSSPCFCSMKWSLQKVPSIQEKPSRYVHFPGQPLLISRGDHVDLEKLLFTLERDFLMKSNGEKVEMDGLSNKYVLLYIFQLVGSHKIQLITRELVELRKMLLDKGFEIVFVGLSSDDTDSSKQQKYFEEYSSQMPWPFIPYEDHDAREHVRSTFGFSHTFFMEDTVKTPYCGIIDPHGKILQSWAWVILSYYGPDAFPFTDENLWSMYEEEDSLFKEGVSLKALLGTSNRDYVLSPEGDKVPIQYLEDKMVCIILDDPVADPHVRIIEDVFANINLDAHPDFVPLYVCRNFPNTSCTKEYIHIEDKSKKEFESVSWLRIPYGDSAIRKIWRVILRRYERDGTICSVVGPHGSYVDFFTLQIMELYGSEAYPFTVRRVAELRAQELQVEFLLEDVLQPTCQINRNGKLEVILHPDCRIPRYGGQKDGDSLVLYNKRLLVLFGTHSCCELGQFLCELRVLYNQKKGTNEEFEVIYISLDCLRSDFEESTSRMPWIVFPFQRKEVANTWSLCKYHFRPHCFQIPAIVAFERDGLLVGMEGYLHEKKDKQAHFPYVNSVTDVVFTLGGYHLGIDDEIGGSGYWSEI